MREMIFNYGDEMKVKMRPEECRTISCPDTLLKVVLSWSIEPKVMPYVLSLLGLQRCQQLLRMPSNLLFPRES